MISPSKVLEMAFQTLVLKFSRGTCPWTPLHCYLSSPVFGGRKVYPPPTFTTIPTPLALAIIIFLQDLARSSLQHLSYVN